MISLKELNPHNYPTTPEIDSNLLELQRLINIVRLHYGQPLTVTSGLRSQAQQDGLIAEGKTDARASQHIIGNAVDIHDDGNIKPWVMANMPLIEQIGLWMESFDYTKTWVHFQSHPPKSGKRFFIP